MLPLRGEVLKRGGNELTVERRKNSEETRFQGDQIFQTFLSRFAIDF